MSEWVRVPQIHKRGSSRPMRAASIKISMFRQTPILVVTLLGATMERCGLKKGDRVSLDYGKGRMARWLRIEKQAGKHLDGDRQIAAAKGSGIIRFSLTGISDELLVTPSTLVEWQTWSSDGIMIRLPDAAFSSPPQPTAAIPEPTPQPAPKAKAAKPTKPAQPKVQADPDDPLNGIPEEDLAEAAAMLKAAKVGAKALAEYFGWSQPNAVRIAAALRDQIESDRLADVRRRVMNEGSQS